MCLGNADFDANMAICESNIEISDEATDRLKRLVKIMNNSSDFANYEEIKNKYCEMTKNVISYDYKYDATEVLNRLRG